MADEKDLYEPDIISVTDENGEEILFELLERYENDDGVYVAITEYRDGDEEYLEEIESEEEFNRVSDILMKMVEEQYDVEYYDPTEQ